jgi:hypothetical protein
MVLCLGLVRDQEVPSSNLGAPTNFLFVFNHLDARFSRTYRSVGNIWEQDSFQGFDRLALGPSSSWV